MRSLEHLMKFYEHVLIVFGDRLLPGSMTITRGELLMETGLRQVLLDGRQSWCLHVCRKGWPLLTWSYTCALSLAASTSNIVFGILPQTRQAN